MKNTIKILSGILITFILTSLVYAQDVIIEANKQTHDATKNITTFEGNVKVTTENITVKSPLAYVNVGADGKPDNAVFVNGAKAVQIKPDTRNEVKADIIKLSLITKKVEAEGSVESNIIEKSAPIVTIKANKQSFNIDTNLMQAEGNVTIKYQDVDTKSNSAKIKMNSGGTLDKVKLIGNAQISQDNTVINGESLLLNPKTMELTAVGNTFSNTIMKDKEATKVSIWADYQQFNKNANTLLTSGNVKIHYKNYVATGPKATMLPSKRTNKTNIIVFTGRSKIKEDNRIIEADKIEITMEPKNFDAQGHVRTQLSQVKNMKSSPNTKNSKNSKTNQSDNTNKEDTNW